MVRSIKYYRDLFCFYMGIYWTNFTYRIRRFFSRITLILSALRLAFNDKDTDWIYILCWLQWKLDRMARYTPIHLMNIKTGRIGGQMIIASKMISSILEADSTNRSLVPKLKKDLFDFLDQYLIDWQFPEK